MKRLGADVRKRTIRNVMNDKHPAGPLTDEEMAAASRAYAEGCRGEIIIGMRGDERIITMLAPETPDITVDQALSRIGEELRGLGCDGYVRVRAADAMRA
jgi:hypothetical protein